MKRISIVNFHIYLAGILYLASLAFPACYLGEERQAQDSAELLICGPFGILVGAFAWYANPFFWFAVVKNKKFISIMLSAFSLFLALSFISYKRVMYVNFDFQKEITFFGWGYFLWVLAISVFLVGQVFKFLDAPAVLIPISTCIPILCIGYIIYGYYYTNADSQYYVQQERNRIYELECRDAGAKIYDVGHDIKSVYFKGHAGEYSRRFLSWEKQSSGFYINAYVNSGYLLFGEEYNYSRNDSKTETNTLYTRYSSQKNSNKNGDEYVNEITSDVSIVIEDTTYPKRVNLKVSTIVIEDRRSNRILAKAKYVFDDYGQRLCGETSNGKFSVQELVKKTLALKRQYPSIYDK
ncbi:MAG: hypothetical protein V4660_06370 [Pseudomonadota bacterium]